MLPDSCQYLSCSLQLHGEDVCLKCILIIWYFYYWLKAKHDVFTGLLYSYFYKFECLVTQNIDLRKFALANACSFCSGFVEILFTCHDLCKWLIDFLWFWLWTFQAICCTPEILWITRQLYPTWKYFEGDLILLQCFISFLHSHSYHACWTLSLLTTAEIVGRIT